MTDKSSAVAAAAPSTVDTKSVAPVLDGKKSDIQSVVAAMLAAEADAEADARKQDEATTEINVKLAVATKKYFASLPVETADRLKQKETEIASRRNAVDLKMADVKRLEAEVQSLIDQRNAIMAELQTVCTHVYATESSGVGQFALTATYCVKCFKQ